MYFLHNMHTFIHTYIQFNMHSYVSTLMHKYVYTHTHTHTLIHILKSLESSSRNLEVLGIYTYLEFRILEEEN